MTSWFTSRWTSSEAINHYFAIFSIATLIFGLLAPFCATVLYKVSQQRDHLKDVAAQTAEERRKLEVFDLNKQITAAATAAKVSVEELDDAQGELIDTRNQLSEATSQATLRLNEYLASKAKLEALAVQSRKIVTIQLRVEALADVPANPGRSKNTYAALNLLAYLYSNRHSQSPLVFRGGQVEALAITPSKVRYVAILEPELPLDLSGANITLLDNREMLASNISSFFEKSTTEGGSNLRLKWILIVNGAAFQLTDEVPPLGIPVNSSGLSVYPVAPEHENISQSYDSLFH